MKIILYQVTSMLYNVIVSMVFLSVQLKSIEPIEMQVLPRECIKHATKHLGDVRLCTCDQFDDFFHGEDAFNKAGALAYVPALAHIDQLETSSIDDEYRLLSQIKDERRRQIVAKNLFWRAIKHKDHQKAEKLCQQYDINPNFRLTGADVRSPLYTAAENGDSYAVIKLLGWGAQCRIPCNPDEVIRDPLITLLLNGPEHGLIKLSLIIGLLS